MSKEQIDKLNADMDVLETENVNIRQRLHAIEAAMMKEDTLSNDERCLVMMYRFVMKNADTPRRIVVTSDGDMQMGHE